MGWGLWFAKVGQVLAAVLVDPTGASVVVVAAVVDVVAVAMGHGGAHFSRRRIAASRPMPPTTHMSPGAAIGGPIGRL